MSTHNQRLTFAISATILVFLLVAPNNCFAQTTDPLVGTWNVKGSSTGLPNFILVTNFNAGGTTEEFDSTGTNPSANESIGLGKWRKVASLAYRFKLENFVYNSSGNLVAIAISNGSLALSSTLNTFSATGNTNFFHCTVSVCPGTLIVSAPFTETGKRF
jgi:hypothetical protein